MAKSKEPKSPTKSKSKSKSKNAIVKVEVKSSAPTLVTFPNGTPSDESSVSFQRFVLKNQNKKSSKLLMGKTDICTFSSRYVQKDEMKPQSTSKYAVGVYDPSDQSLKLYPSTKVCALTQGVIGYKSSFLESHSKNEAVTSYLQRRDALFDAFGSIKKKRVLKSMAANIVSVDTLANAKNVMKNVNAHSGDQDDESKDILNMEDVTAYAYDEARKKILPPYNIDAKSPKDVYQPKLIAEDEAWGQISRVVTACKHCESDTWLDALCSKGKWPDLILQLLKGISIEHTSGLDQIKTVVMLKHLLNFHRFCKKPFLNGTVEELSNNMHIPTQVCTRFLDMFSAPTSRPGKEGFDLTQQLRDKCVIHILILFIIAHGPKMKVEDISNICEEIKVEIPKASNMLREAGFVIRKNASQMVTATLNVPLKFPPPKMRRR